jgi:hypothetical protein
VTRADARQALQHAASAAWLASQICRQIGISSEDPELQAAAEKAIEAAASFDALADGLPDLKHPDTAG